MDELRIRVEPPNQLQGDLVITVLVNGEVVTNDNYCLDVDSFFSCVGLLEGTMEFIGSCGVRGCCGEVYKTRTTANSWQWGWPGVIDLEITWADAYAAAQMIILAVECLPEEGWVCKELHPRLPFYRDKLEELKQLAASAQAET